MTLAAAVCTFLYRFWGGMPVALQADVVVATPLFLVAGMEIASRRERTLYVTLLLGLLGLLAAGLLLLLRRLHGLARRGPE